MNEALLSERIARMVSADFFRPLTRPSAPVSIDCAQRLMAEAGLAGRLPLAEAQQVIREVLLRHPQAKLDDDEGAQLRDVRQRASMFLNKLLGAGWLEEQVLGLQDRRIIVSPGLRLLMTMLRALAEDEVAELQTFADTLRAICETLEQENALDPFGQLPGVLRARVNDLNQRLDLAISQLYLVEKLIAGFEARQRQSESAAETLRLFYSEFTKGQHMVCYDVLSKEGLLSRLRQVRAKVAEALDDQLVRDRLASELAEHFKQEVTYGQILAREMLARLERGLAGLAEIARAIDERMAAFNRLSQQRYRYQTELRGRKPELVKAYCDAIDAAYAGSHFRKLADLPVDFQPLCPEVKFHFGTQTLWKKSNRRTPVDLGFSQGRATTQDEEDALQRLKERQRLALTPLRAAKLVSRLIGNKKGSITTSDFACNSTDELLDLLATVAYDHAHDDHGKLVRWEVKASRQTEGMEPAGLLRDQQLDWKIDQFSLKRTV